MEPEVRIENVLNLIEVEMDGLKATFRDTKRGLVFVRSMSGKIDARNLDPRESWIPQPAYDRMYQAAMRALTQKSAEAEFSETQLLLPLY